MCLSHIDCFSWSLHTSQPWLQKSLGAPYQRRSLTNSRACNELPPKKTAATYSFLSELCKQETGKQL
ncbi:hypothetical protein HanXRQr2_Chr05g0223531 [Helianthus annuus]|uniref:Uncharacterized protein n=1 Tax=Helianthus annuus TaxID=4232 RepID=A0A251UTB2_HELAN|nr:hypothetical protein HanXRQr2_Chr05g0223531 [Helianthus annuus]KAJ0585213.1 hypothetical protein HanHA89_Chr05g0197691 [Helianthus annuus]